MATLKEKVSNPRFSLPVFIFIVIALLLGWFVWNSYLSPLAIPDKIIVSLATSEDNNDWTIFLPLSVSLQEAQTGCSGTELKTRKEIKDGLIEVVILGYDRYFASGLCQALVYPETQVIIPLDSLPINSQLNVSIYLRGQENTFTLQRHKYKVTLLPVETTNVEMDDVSFIVRAIVPEDVHVWYTNRLDVDQREELKALAKSKNVKLAEEVYPEVAEVFETLNKHKDRILVVSSPQEDSNKAEFVGKINSVIEVYSIWAKELTY